MSASECHVSVTKGYLTRFLDPKPISDVNMTYDLLTFGDLISHVEFDQ